MRRATISLAEILALNQTGSGFDASGLAAQSGGGWRAGKHTGRGRRVRSSEGAGLPGRSGCRSGGGSGRRGSVILKCEYAWLIRPNGASTSTSMPTSSRSSRRHAASSDSPSSRLPPGNSHSPAQQSIFFSSLNEQLASFVENQPNSDVVMRHRRLFGTDGIRFGPTLGVGLAGVVERAARA